MNAEISSLGACTIPSPLRHAAGANVMFREDGERVLHDHTLAAFRQTRASDGEPLSFEIAGPREKIFFQPSKISAGIVTCGGLCPGLNDVIRGLVMELWYRYGVQRILGFRYGYEGLIERFGHTPVNLRPEGVATINQFGGSVLGVSRGPQDVPTMVDTLEQTGVDLLFVIGGDGTLRGAAEIADECKKRGHAKAVVGIPKTIDNDILYLDKSFGFETAFAEAVKAISCAHTESLGSMNGVGLVKLMGRDSGFIACYASLAGSDANYVLIPEIPFSLDGPRGLLESLRHRLAKRRHAVIVVAEGAGQDLMRCDPSLTDASGNRRLGDIGQFLKDQIGAFFKARRTELNLKYIDPSYTIRSVPAGPQDNVYCSQLAQHAAHAAMAGKTSMLVGRWHGTFINLPLAFVTGGRRKVDPSGELWNSVLEATGQPPQIG
jgi:6-phosphofructokinase 1